MATQEITGRQIKDGEVSEADLGATAVAGAQGWFHNLAIVRATTTNSGDSIKLTSADGSALSSTNYGTAWLPSTSTPGLFTKFTFTSDTTMLLSGMTPWGDGLGDLNGAILRILLVNDNGTCRLAAAYLGGRTTLLTTDTTATPASVTAPEHVLCNVAISSASNTCREIGYARLDFTDSTNVVAIQTGVNDVVTGQTADGQWQPYNTTVTGFSSIPPTGDQRWCSYGRTGTVVYSPSNLGTSNATTYTLTSPFKARYYNYGLTTSDVFDNGASRACGTVQVETGSTTIRCLTTGRGLWTASGNKTVSFTVSYEMGPAASFID